jgi:hypothetical protein
MKTMQSPFVVATLTLATAMSQAWAQSSTWTSELASLDTKPAALVGTLVIPHGTATVPLAIIIAGSGPTDRDGNGQNLRPNNLKQLAEALAERDVASLRYDKRGIAGSVGAGTSEAELRFDMYADDAAAWVKKYRADPRFGPIVVIGHSEGSLLGMLAVQRAPADGFVSVAGTARRADRVLHDQLAVQLSPPLLAQADSVLASLAAGKTVDNSPPMLAMLFRPSVQPYMISWFKYSGSVEIARLRVPTLIVQGTSDIQVAPAEADSLKLALPAAQLLVFTGMNHVMKSTPPGRAEQMAAYTDPTMPLMAGLADSVGAFVRRIRK